MNWREGLRRIGLVLFAPFVLLFVWLTIGQFIGAASFLYTHWLDILVIAASLFALLTVGRWIVSGFLMK